MPRTRRRAREVALQVLYQMDLNPGADLEEILERGQGEAPATTAPLAELLVRGTLVEIDAIDAHINRASAHWRIERMPPVDRNILRMAAYEMLYTDTPAKVVINEAIDIAKKYGGEGSGMFVNGILDHIAHEARVA